VLEHGGRLRSAAEKYNISLENWIDLSTGINPHGWPVPEIPVEHFARLPEDNDGLMEVAKNYYAVEDLLPVPGSQSVIQLLPRLRTKCCVAVPEIAYAEHAHAWQQAGHEVNKISSQSINQQLDQYDVLVLINPNNPSGETFSAEQLLNWHQRLSEKNGWLIVDEAFMDSSSQHSLLPYSNRQGLIVLRSVGKFFGLAGIRCGFVMAEAECLKKIHNALGPWTLTGPTRFVASMALVDQVWQDKARAELKIRAEKLQYLISHYLNKSSQGTDLFQTVFLDNASEWHEQLAKQGVLTRLLDNKQGIRFGLPKNNQWQKFENILERITNNIKQVIPA